MKNIKLKIDAVFVLISLVSLLYIRQYEVILYYKATNLMNIMYIRVAVPFFYYFLAAYIVVLFIDLFDVSISDLVKKFSEYFSGAAICLYLMVIILEISSSKIVPYYSFVSKYSILFIVSGCLFALAIKANLNKKEM